MKIGTLHHPKTSRLAKLLDVPRFAAVGLLDSLWHLAADAADEGDVGRFSNAEIADYLEWTEDPDKLIQVLVDARWLDESDEHRLVVHDWLDHCPSFIADRLKKRRQRAAKQRKQKSYDNSNGDTSGQKTTKQGSGEECPLSTQSSQFNSSPTSSWVEVEEALKSAGVAAAVQATAAAQARGASPEEVQLLIDLYSSKPGAWGPGALHKRITGELSDWPEPSVEYRREQQHLADQAKAIETEKKRQQESAMLKAEQERLDQIEREYGPVLDAMDQKERDELLEVAEPNREARKFLTGRNTLLRERLLDHLASVSNATV